jgi:hypothetical protein
VLSEQTSTSPERLSPESTRALLEHSYELLNERDTRHIPTIFTEDIEFNDDATR